MESAGSSDLNTERARLRIAVCDDEAAEADHLKTVLVHVLNGHEADIEVFGSAEALLSSSTRFHLIFLDILMDGRTGMDAARELYVGQNRALVVFVTNSRDYVLEGYEVEAFRYVVKPYTEDEIRRIVRQAYDRIEKQGMLVRSGSSLHRIPLETICYVEAQAHRCLIHLTDMEILPVNEGISQLEKRIPGGRLIRCHKSFIVNLEHIARIKRYDAIMKDGSLVPVGRHLWHQLQDCMLNYLAL